MNHWLFKTEPESFSIDDLAKAPRKTTFWNGVRNYQARNTMRDDVKKGDLVLFYHSNAKPAGIVGICEVVKAAYPDTTAWDPNNDYHDPKATPEVPRWVMVDIQLKEKFTRMLTLDELKMVKSLDGMVLLQRGSRLSIQPVTPRHYQAITAMAKR